MANFTWARKIYFRLRPFAGPQKKGGITVPFLFTILPASVILAVHLLSGLRVNQHGSWHEQGKKAMVQVLIRTFLSVIPNSGRCLGNY